jgi:hypothetical protein
MRLAVRSGGSTKKRRNVDNAGLSDDTTPGDRSMKFRLKAFGTHLLASLAAMTLIVGTLYLGWYRWPGWYLADALQVVFVMASVDLVVGPLLTLVIANPGKGRRELTRDVAMIVGVQLIALAYGSWSLWDGRPLYYAFSESVLQQVQAYDLETGAPDATQQAPLAPHWYSTPRWIWAPLPSDPAERDKIVTGAVTGGDDVISMPRYFKPWDAGLPALRAQLKKVKDVAYFAPAEKKLLEQRMRAAGYDPDQPNVMPFTGRGPSLLAVFDPATLKIVAFFKGK